VAGTSYIEHFAFDIDGAPKIDDAAIHVTPRSAVANTGCGAASPNGWWDGSPTLYRMSRLG
jgi:hypothetical protein